MEDNRNNNDGDDTATTRRRRRRGRNAQLGRPLVQSLLHLVRIPQHALEQKQHASRDGVGRYVVEHDAEIQ